MSDGTGLTKCELALSAALGEVHDKYWPRGHTNQLMGKSSGTEGFKKDILIGAALGPVFNSCSPTYALMVAFVLPTMFLVGLGYLAAYSIGLGLILLLISIFGRILVDKMKWLSNPNGLFQKSSECFSLLLES